MDNSLTVEVVYALSHRQKMVRVSVPVGTTLRQAVELSGISAFFPDLNTSQAPLGIFSKVVPKPEERLVEDGDRIEIYRPLIADPKEVRKQRAAKLSRKDAETAS
ncbi:MAG: RnfH family protein [Pseudomonas sp.]